MQIETKHLILRDHVKSDWKDIHEYCSLPDFSQYDTWGPNSEDDTKSFVQFCIENARLKSRYKFDLAVVHKETNKTIGGVGIRRTTESSLIADIGYAINPKFQGQGLAVEAGRAMLDFAFKQLDLVLVWATCDCRNIPSYKVMEKIGMRRVGQILKHKKVRENWRDSYRYEIISPNI